MAKKKAATEVKTEARFAPIGGNMIFDRKTSLYIIQDPKLLGEKFSEIMTYEEALAAVADLNTKGYGGFKDWRLPTREELVGMTDPTKHNPCYDTNIFKGKFDDWYWCKETCAWNSGAAWCVSSSLGSVDSSYRYDHYYVRPVRSSQCQFAPLPR